MSYHDHLLAYLPERKTGKKKKAKKRTYFDAEVTHADSWQYQVYQDWRDNSSALQRIRNNAVRFQQTCDIVKRGLQHAQSQIADQVDSSRDAVVVALKQQLKSARSKLRRALQQQQQQKASEEVLEADLAACSKCVRGSKQDSQNFALGILIFGALAFVCGSAPWMLPALYLAFAAVALPWRIHQFYCKRLTFFLLDFCYVSAVLLDVDTVAMQLLMAWSAEMSMSGCSGQTWQRLLSYYSAATIVSLEPWYMRWLMDLWREPCLCGRVHGCLVQLHIVSGNAQLLLPFCPSIHSYIHLRLGPPIFRHRLALVATSISVHVAWVLTQSVRSFDAVCTGAEQPSPLWQHDTNSNSLSMLDSCRWLQHSHAGCLCPCLCHAVMTISQLFLTGDVCCSVLIHLLPGLALFAHQHFPPPASIAHIGLLNPVSHGSEIQIHGSASFWWVLVAPTIFYAAWQTMYWFVVQVSALRSLFVHFIRTLVTRICSAGACVLNVCSDLLAR